MSILYYGFPCVFWKMNTRRTPTRIVEENDVHEDIPPQVEQVKQAPQGAQGSQGYQGDHVPIVEGGNNVPVVRTEFSNSDITKALLVFA